MNRFCQLVLIASLTLIFSCTGDRSERYVLMTDEGAEEELSSTADSSSTDSASADSSEVGSSEAENVYSSNHEIKGMQQAVSPDISSVESGESQKSDGDASTKASAQSSASDSDSQTPERSDRLSAEFQGAEAEYARLRDEFLSRNAPPLSGEPMEIKLLVPHKEFSRSGPRGELRITYDDIDLLKVLNMEKVIPEVMQHLPDWLKELDGQRVVLRGWMRPGYRLEGISSFIFVRDNGTCCFGPNAKIYDKIGVRLQEGKTTRYVEGRPIDVAGTFAIRPDFTEEENAWLYFLDDAVIVDR